MGINYDNMPQTGIPVLLHSHDATVIKVASTHLYIWLERGTVRVKCLNQEHNEITPARDRTQTTRSGVERTTRRTSVNKGFLICNF